jgi:hypothetical protein
VEGRVLISLVTITHEPTPAALRNIKVVFAAARETHPDVETLVVDTSEHNIGYGGALNKAAAQCRGDVFVYFSSNRAKMYDREWLARIVAPLSDPNCGMAGSVRPCQFDRIARRPCDIWEPQIHVQGGVFAARTAVLRENPWSPYFPQVFSDVYQAWNLIKSGFYLADVAEVQSREDGRAHPAQMICDYAADAELDEEFERRCKQPSDINAHGIVLRDLAARANRVTEFGVSMGNSTVFLLASRPRQMRSVDIDPAVEINVQSLLKLVPQGTDFRFSIADSRTCDIDMTDLLFIDTDQNYECLSIELRRHCNRVTRRIALHDTVSFPVCRKAMQDFVAENQEWRVLRHYQNNNGLTVLERQAGSACTRL